MLIWRWSWLFLPSFAHTVYCSACPHWREFGNLNSNLAPTRTANKNNNNNNNNNCSNLEMTELSTRQKSLLQVLQGSYGADESLAKALMALGEATARIKELLDTHMEHREEHRHVGTQNASGDDQLHLDIASDDMVFEEIRKCGLFQMAASEETPEETKVGEGPYSLAFDPLDGSSIVDANFAIGSIFGIFHEGSFINKTGRDQVAAAVSVYGPRTVIVIALPPDKCFELMLVNDHWEVTRPHIVLKDSGKVFAPGNLRASNDNKQYAALIQHWIENRYTLRYTGGMVPDIYHIFAKGKGVFSNVSSEKAKAKLRLLYEVAPMGLIVECAGGRSVHETTGQSVLDIPIEHLDHRLGLCLGSKDEVAKFEEFMIKK